MIKKIFLISSCIFLFSCEKDEIAIPVKERDNLIVREIALESDYRYQVFYKLNGDKVVSQNLNTVWDLGFESSQDGWRIILNSSLGGAVAHSNTDSFEQEPILSQLEWMWDRPSGDLDSTAIGDYRGQKNIYVLDRGFSYTNTSDRYKKFIIDSITSTFYKIRYASLDNSSQQQAIIYKDASVNFNAYSISSNSSLIIEPNKTEWDLVFTRYIRLYSDPSLPPSYLVTGVLSNYLNNIQVAIDTINDFQDIDISFDSNGNTNYFFNNNRDAIGYNWKIFNGTDYTIRTNNTYIIKDSFSRYYKLRFIDFYNSLGEKGFPTFEVQEL